jgi:hypothetical protein
MSFRDIASTQGNGYFGYCNSQSPVQETRVAKSWRLAVLSNLVLLAASAFGATYYIAANGSDSNAGTSKTAPWLHAPGMPSCSGSCSSHTPVAGDQFILRGGDTWHFHTGNPQTGGTWGWTRNGTSSSPIYIGVDQTWFSGASFSRPILNQDNATSTSNVSSCTFDESNSTAVSIDANFVTFDNFEFTGYCWSGNPSFAGHTIAGGMSGVIISNNYFHGWTHTASANDTAYMIKPDNGSDYQFVGNVVDGSDTTSINGQFSMFALYGPCTDIHQNVIRYVSNAAVCYDLTELHDNLFEHIGESFDGVTHGNVAEWNNEAGPTLHIYNNVVRHIAPQSQGGLGVGFWIWVTSGSNTYMYNNLFYDITPGAGIAGNCIDVSGISGGSNEHLYFYNNTILTPCTMIFQSNPGTPCFNGTATFSNNHLIGFGTPGNINSFVGTNNCNLPSISELSGDIFQSTATSTSQGYTSATAGGSGGETCANDSTPCAPTSSGNSTVNAGSNYTGSCSTFGGSNALCSDSTLGVALGANGTLLNPARTPNARPTTSAWDAGAYEFASTVGGPAPPTGLSAVVK